MKKRIRSFCAYHDPHNTCKIIVRGENVSKEQQALEELLKLPEYVKYAIETISIEVKSDSRPGLSFYIKQQAPDKSFLVLGNDEQVSVIELTIDAVDTGKKRGEESVGHYGVTTGHSFLSNDHQGKLERSYEHHESVSNEIAAQYWEQRPYLKRSSGKSIDTVERPLILYRRLYYWEQKDDSSFVHDLGIVKLDKEQMRKDRWDENNISLQYGRVPEAKPRTRSGLSNDVRQLHYTDSKELQKLVGKKIVCGGKRGKIVPHPL